MHVKNSITTALRRHATMKARRVAVSILAIAFCSIAVVVSAAPVGFHLPSFNRPGNLLIADQFNNRVIEVNAHGEIIWQWGIGPNDYSPQSIVGVNDAQRIGHFTLMAGTGIPAGASPNCTRAAGCPDNRVLLVDHLGNIRWQYGKFGITGSGFNELNAPVQATFLPSSHILITDQGNQRVIEVETDREIVFQYGTTGVAGNGPDQLDSPNSAELLENGNFLIADEGNNRAIEVRATDKAVIATFTAGGTTNAVAFASRLPNGDTLLTDSGNNRIVEVNSKDAIVWQYVTNMEPGSNSAPLPTRAIRLVNGNTIISDQFNQRVIIVDPAGNIVKTYGKLNVPGDATANTSEGLFAPYDAKVLGDFTGLTPPFTYYLAAEDPNEQ